MSSYLRLIVRFSHVFFISTCCQSNGLNPIQEDSKGPRFPAPGADVQAAISLGSEEVDDESSSEEEFQEVSLE
jgi:hypothetical protein